MKTKLLALLLMVLTIQACNSSSETDITEIEKDETPSDSPVKDEEPEEEEEPTTYPFTKDGVKYGEDYVVFEPEITNSELGLWVRRVAGDAVYHEGNVPPINNGYLEFTGNNLNGGSAKSPLSYTFVCQKTGKYRIVMRMYQPLNDHEEGDKRNDVWIKLAGTFTSSCVFPTDALKHNHKFWGRGVRKWGSAHKMEGHVNGVKKLNKAIYYLSAGQSYTLTISGRAQGCSLDYILFYNDVSNYSIETHDDPAVKLPPSYMPDVIEAN